MPGQPWNVYLDQANSTFWILSTIVFLIVLAGALFLLGWADRAIGFVGRVIESLIRRGFRLWEQTLAWTRWPSFTALVVGMLTVGIYQAHVDRPWISLLISMAVLTGGVTACLAYMYVSMERYQVARGYKTINKPAKGQELARHVVLYGDKLGPIMLAVAALGTIFSFALLNQSLFETIGERWYITPDNLSEPKYTDFLAFSLINLLRIVDMLDVLRSSHFLGVTFVRQNGWPVAGFLLVFKSFFMLVLVQQIVAALRDQRMLWEMVEDFWTPHPPIHERARAALSQFGPLAVSPVMQALRKAETLTGEQRDELPNVLAEIGPHSIPDLMRYLFDERPTVRGVAVTALGKLRAPEAVPALVLVSGDTNETVRIAVIEALGAIGESLSAPGKPPPSFSTREQQRRWRRYLAVGGRMSVSTLSYCWDRCRSLLGRKRPPWESHSLDPFADCLNSLRTAVGDAAAPVRTQAILGLGKIGPRAQVATADLISVLHSRPDPERAIAAEALGKLQGDPAEIVPVLVSATCQGSPAVRSAAATAIGTFKERAASAVSQLATLLDDQSEEVRTAATTAIQQIGTLNAHATRVLENQLEDPDNVARARTAEALGGMGEAAESAAPALVESLRDSNDLVRMKAAEALGRIGNVAAGFAVPALIIALDDADNNVKEKALEALGNFGESAVPALPRLLSALEDDNPKVRRAAAITLGRLQIANARTALEGACADREAAVRAAAITALHDLPEPGDATFTIMHHALQDADPGVRVAAINALTHGPADRARSLQAVAGMVDDTHDDVALRAMQVLPDFGPDAVPLVIDALKRRLAEERNEEIPSAAAATLAAFGSAAESAADELAHVAQSGVSAVRQAALRALTMVRPDTAIKALAIGLQDADPAVRKQASAGLFAIDVKDEEIIPALLESLHDPDPRVRANSTKVLARYDSLPSSAETLLIANAMSPNEDLRRATAEALRRFDTVRSRDCLKQLQGDPHDRVREEAIESLKLLDPEVPPEPVESPREEMTAAGM